ncbi:MAG: tetratricopeptide repeat protein [Catalinimonas sp.]
MKTRALFLLTPLLLLPAFSAQAQFNWPEDKAAAQSQWVQFSDNVKAKQFATARPNFLWLYREAPELNEGLYVKGISMYEGLAAKATDAKVKSALQDTALMLYDERIKYYGEEAEVLNRKGIVAFTFLGTRPDAAKHQEALFALYQRIFELNGTENVYPHNVTPYMYLACQEKAAGRLNDQEVLVVYDQVLKAYEQGVKKDESLAAYWEQVKEDADKRLTSCVEIDCDFVKEQLAPKLKANPDDIDLAKKIESFLLSGGCSDDPLFLSTAKLIQEREPGYGWAILIAKKEFGNKNYDESFSYYDQAIELAETTEKKAEVHLDLAKRYSYLGRKSQARAEARKAASMGAGGEAYELIGDLYFNSAPDCTGNNAVENRLAYLAAYEEYRKAGNSTKMSRAKAQFPSRVELFNYNMEPGQTMSTGCWIGETVTLMTRPE